MIGFVICAHRPTLFGRQNERWWEGHVARVETKINLREGFGRGTWSKETTPFGADVHSVEPAELSNIESNSPFH